MNWFAQVKIILLTLLVCISIDLVWLGIIAQRFYYTQLLGIADTLDGKILINWKLALPVYLLLALGIHYFVLIEALRDGATQNIFIRPALLGLLVYGVYEFTNACLIPDWSLKLVIVDTLWGMTFFVLASNGVRWLAKVMKIT